MTLIRTSLLNAIAVAVKMATLLGLNKVLALYVGPAGYAAIGQLQNAVTMFTTLASGAVSTGVTKYTAEFAEQPDEQRKIWRTAGTLSVVVSLLLAVLIMGLRKPLASWFSMTNRWRRCWSGLPPRWCSLPSTRYCLACSTARRMCPYVLANILGSLISLVVTCALTIQLGLYGALVALAVYQSLSFVATLVICMRTPWFHLGDFLAGWTVRP